MTTCQMMNAQGLARKVEWEGGVIAALEYGIRSEEIDDPELSALWHRMETLYDQLRPCVRAANRLMIDATRQPVDRDRVPGSAADLASR